MELKLQLSVFALLMHISLAMWQRVTVFKGQTLNLSCPLTNAHRTNVDWKNPEGYIMFFNRKKALKDKRYSINKLSEFEFTISISNVTFKDGGNYTCSQYDNHATEKKVEVTVLGRPKMKVAKHGGMFVIKCIAEGNHHPPQIYWKLDQGPEIIANAQVLREGKRHVTMDMLHVQSVENRVTVKCLVRHPALHSQPLMNFVKIGRDSSDKSRPTTTSSSATTSPQGSAGVQRITTTVWFKYSRTTVNLPIRNETGPSSGSTTKSSTPPLQEPETITEPTGLPLSTGSHDSTIGNSTTSLISGSTRRRNGTISNATSTTGWPSVSETTSFNSTEGNKTGSFNVPDMQTGTEGSSSLLIFLVTCLIGGLLVIVIFFAIMLRRAHITWKKENEDPDPSEESSKSKSSQEERTSQGRRGLFQTAFTRYDVEKPTVIATAWTAATQSENKEQPLQSQTPGQTSARCEIKETEL